MKKPLTNKQVYRYLCKELKHLITLSNVTTVAGVFCNEDPDDVVSRQHYQVYECAEKLLAFIIEQKIVHGNMVIGEEMPGITNIMIAAEHAKQRKRNRS